MDQYVWHQSFMVEGVRTPGAQDIYWLIERAGLPNDMTGMRVLDVGTTNGAVAFECERRGASEVLATDIVGPDHYGFAEIAQRIGSNVSFRQCSVYGMAHQVKEPFDLVVFWGVLYHLRHPLLALDNLRAVTAGHLSLETAVLDGDQCRADFFRGDEYASDSSNWWVPTVSCLTALLHSSGFHVQGLSSWGDASGKRAICSARTVDGPPEYSLVSYEPVIGSREFC